MMQKNYLESTLMMMVFKEKNLIKIDEHGELRNYGFNTFDDTTNLTDLYEDFNTGKLCLTDAEDRYNPSGTYRSRWLSFWI